MSVIDTRSRFQCSSASRKFLNAATSQAYTPASPGFSALQRAENSSIEEADIQYRIIQCFSALQRAENSSISVGWRYRRLLSKFQCSSASRKFLNKVQLRACSARSRRFSALQRAENSSILEQFGDMTHHPHVSVLFSEPKIPQSPFADSAIRRAAAFQCSSASRKFLNATTP